MNDAILKRREDFVVNRFLVQHGADGNVTAGQCLGDDDDIGIYIAVMFHGQKAAGAAKAGLDFIHDKQRAVFAAQTSGFAQIACIRNSDAFALDGLNNKRGDVFGAKRFFKSAKIVVLDFAITGQKRAEAVAEYIGAVKRERAGG